MCKKLQENEMVPNQCVRSHKALLELPKERDTSQSGNTAVSSSLAETLGWPGLGTPCTGKLCPTAQSCDWDLCKVKNLHSLEMLPLL